MALTIKTTGVEDYVTGDGRIKMLVVGGPGVGKTRMSSFWPRPIYADTEGGRGSLVDRNVPYASINSSQDMLDFLTYLKGFESKPRDQRPYDTVVIDTLDGFQRKVIDEWLLQSKQQTFTGFDAWGYLDAKMQMLLTRLLNLDLNVLNLVHYKDKLVGKGDEQTREITFQLKGGIADSLTNDFDLVGRLGTFWAAEGGERVEKRGLTFKKTPDWSILKDRFGVMPPWTEISLTSEQDYEFIRDAFKVRLESLKAGEVVGEIPSTNPATVAAAGVVAPEAGPLPPVDPKEMPLNQFDRPTLAKMARDEGVKTTVDGQPLRGNSLKSEIVAAIEAHRAAKAAAPAEPTDVPAESDASPASPAEQPAEAPAVDVPAQREPEPVTDVASTNVDAAPVEPPAEVSAQVDTATGEINPSEPVGSVVEAPVAEVPSEPAPAETPMVPAQPAPESCPACGKSLEGENPDYLKLSYIKYRQKLCNGCYLAKKASA